MRCAGPERLQASQHEAAAQSAIARESAEAQAAALRREVASLRATVAEKELAARRTALAANFKSSVQQTLLEGAKHATSLDAFVRDFSLRTAEEKRQVMCVLLETMVGSEERVKAVRALIPLTPADARTQLAEETLAQLSEESLVPLLASQAGGLSKKTADAFTSALTTAWKGRAPERVASAYSALSMERRTATVSLLLPRMSVLEKQHLAMMREIRSHEGILYHLLKSLIHHHTCFHPLLILYKLPHL